MKIITKSSKETKELAQSLGNLLLEEGSQDLIFLALNGELGAGKTTFVQGLARGLGIKEKILSPTFVLMKGFEIPKSSNHNIRGQIKNFSHPRPIPAREKSLNLATEGFRHFYHLDCYRLESYKELNTINFKQILKTNNIVIMEWANKVKKVLPKKYLKIEIKCLGKNEREITISW